MAPLLAWNWILKNLLSSDSHRWSLKCTSDERFKDGVADRSKLHKQIDIPDFSVSLWGCYLMTIYIFLLLFLGKYICSKASKSNSACVGWRSPLVWLFCLHSSLTGVHSISTTGKNGTIDSFISFYVNWKWKGRATSFGHSRSITAACMGGKLAFSSFPPLGEEEKWQLELYRRFHGR